MQKRKRKRKRKNRRRRRRRKRRRGARTLPAVSLLKQQQLKKIKRILFISLQILGFGMGS
jgi:hypothetical protein